MIVDYNWLKQRTFDFHSVSRRQAEILSIPYPLQPGWIQKSIGKTITDDEMKEFSMIAHYNKEKRERKYKKKNQYILSQFGNNRKPLFDDSPKDISKVTFDDMRKI